MTKKQTSETPAPATGNYRVAPGIGASAVYVPELGNHLTPDPQLVYPGDHPLVLAAPWMFAAEADYAQLQADRVGIAKSAHTPIGG